MDITISENLEHSLSTEVAAFSCVGNVLPSEYESVLTDLRSRHPYSSEYLKKTSPYTKETIRSERDYDEYLCLYALQLCYENILSNSGKSSAEEEYGQQFSAKAAELSRLTDINRRQLNELEHAVEKINHWNAKNWLRGVISILLLSVILASFSFLGYGVRRISYEEGRNMGYESGELSGYSQGYREGESKGYDAGFLAGQSSRLEFGYSTDVSANRLSEQQSENPESNTGEETEEVTVDETADSGPEILEIISPASNDVETVSRSVDLEKIEESNGDVPEEGLPPSGTSDNGTGTDNSVQSSDRKAESSTSSVVYVSKSGVIHRLSNCSGMKNSTAMDINAALSAGYRPCSKCY